MFPEKLKRDDLFQVQRLPRWLLVVIAAIALAAVVIPALGGRSAEDNPFIVVEMPSPQVVNQAAIVPELLIDWAYTEEAVRQNGDTGARFFVWQRETVCYDCESVGRILQYFDEAFAEDGWQKREGGCPLAEAAGQIFLSDVSAEAHQGYAPPTDMDRWAEACVLVTQTAVEGRNVFRVLLMTTNPA